MCILLGRWTKKDIPEKGPVEMASNVVGTMILLDKKLFSFAINVTVKRKKYLVFKEKFYL